MRKSMILQALAMLLMVAGVTVAQAKNIQTAVFAGGCFWCVESDFDKVKGVISTTSGYTGGKTKNPTYKQISKGGTGHFEAVKIEFDADIVSYEQLLNAFWHSVDVTDAGGQFCDRGDSYRTAVFATTTLQAATAEQSKAAAQKRLGQTIVTPILMAGPFYLAEEYHQDYYLKNDIVITRRGPKTKAEAYKFYRKSCGRDKRVKALWGELAFPGS